MLDGAATNGCARKPLVLLVEDDRLTRMVLKDVLRQCGYSVEIAENGEVALDKLHKASRSGKAEYRLVLTDIYMPKMNGEKLIEGIRRSASLAHIPIAVMSSNDSEHDVKRVLESGASEYLVKPVSKQKLTQLRNLLSGTALKQSRPRDDDKRKRGPRPSKLARITSDTCICEKLLDAAQSMAVDAAVCDVKESGTSSDQSQRTSSSLHATALQTNEAVPSKRVTSPPSARAPPVPRGAPGRGARGRGAGSGRSTGERAVDSGCDGKGAAPLGDVVPVVVPGRNGEPPVMRYMVLSSARPASDGKASSAEVPTALPIAISPSKASGGVAQGKDVAVDLLSSLQVPVLTPPTAVAAQMARKAALERFRAKKLRASSAPKVRYQARKKLAEARPRYKGQFIKLDALPPGASWDPPKRAGA